MVSDWDEVVRLDLVYCEVCGEPIYSTAYRDEVMGKFYGIEQAKLHALCPTHRQEQLAATLAGRVMTIWRRK